MLSVSRFQEYSTGFRVQVIRGFRSESREMLIQILKPELGGEEVLFSVKMDSLSTDFEEKFRSESLTRDETLLAKWQLMVLKGNAKSKPAIGTEENSIEYESGLPLSFEIEIILGGFSLNARFDGGDYPPVEFDMTFMDGAVVLHLEGEWSQELDWQESDEDIEVF